MAAARSTTRPACPWHLTIAVPLLEPPVRLDTSTDVPRCTHPVTSLHALRRAGQMERRSGGGWRAVNPAASRHRREGVGRPVCNFLDTSPGFEMRKGQPTRLRRLATGSANGGLTLRGGGSGSDQPSDPAPRPPLQRCSRVCGTEARGIRGWGGARGAEMPVS